MGEKRIIDNWIDGYLYYMKECESPQLYLEWSAISALAAAVQRKVWLQWGFTQFFPNFYILLVGPPGQTRKGTALAPAKELLRKLGIPLAPDSITREQLIRRLAEATDTMVMESGLPKSHSSLTIFSPEFCVFLNKKEERLMTDLTDWYDCGTRWDYETKNAGVDYIVGVYVNLLGATTPALIHQSLPVDAIGSGLTSRIIFVCANKKRFKQPEDLFPMSEEGKMVFENLLHDIRIIKEFKGAFKIGKSFHSRYVDWYRAMPDTPPFEPDRFSAYWSRRPTHIRKLSMIMSINSRSDLILKAEDFDKSLALLERTESKMPLAFGCLGRDKTASILPGIMATIQHEKKISFGALLKLFLKETNNWELERIIMTLKKTRFIDVQQTSEDRIIIYKGVGGEGG